MVYSFKHAHSVEEQFRSIACYQIDAALGALKTSSKDRPKAVHDIRKRCKKLRGLVRLVRPSFPDYQKENAAFRKVAHLFDDLRDAKVMQDTYDLLMDAFDEQVDRKAFSQVRCALTRRRNELLADTDWKSRKRRARHLLEQARGRVREWSLADRGWDALQGGLEITYGRARAAMSKAIDEPTGPNIHDWRKRAKYHWHHTRLLRQLDPKPLKGRASHLRDLADILGQAHDIHVFTAALESDPEAFADEETLMVLHALADCLSASFAERAAFAGARLFADETDIVSSRWSAWWSVWQEEEERQSDAA